MKKIFLLVLFLCSFLLIGCGKDELEMALEQLKTTSYTADLEMNMTMDMPSGSFSQTSISKMEVDPTQLYMETSVDNGASSIQTVCNYIKLEETAVKVYTKYGEVWDLTETPIEEYTSNNDLLDIDTKEIFELKDGVYVGDTTKLEEQLATVLEEQFGDMGYGVTPEMKIAKYNITLDGDNVKNIEIVIDMTATIEGVTMEIGIDIKYTFSKIGSTLVTIPEALKSDDNKQENNIDTLEKALEKIKKSNYTLNQTFSVVTEFNGQTNLEIVNTKSEVNKTQIYSISTYEFNDNLQQNIYYTKLEETVAKVYNKDGDTWDLLEIPIEDFSTDSTTNVLFNIDVEDAFILQDGVYVGDVIKLKEQLVTYLEEALESEITEFIKYDITLDGDNVKNIEIVFNMQDSYGSGNVKKYTLSFECAFSKIGSTVVTVPENLPTE